MLLPLLINLETRRRGSALYYEIERLRQKKARGALEEEEEELLLLLLLAARSYPLAY